MRTLEHVRTEMSLHVLAYNMKRVLNIVGLNELKRAIQALNFKILASLGLIRLPQSVPGVR